LLAWFVYLARNESSLWQYNQRKNESESRRDSMPGAELNKLGTVTGITGPAALNPDRTKHAKNTYTGNDRQAKQLCFKAKYLATPLPLEPRF
jgi:hypothetical protein